MDLEHLKYPIGKDQNEEFTSENKDQAIATIAEFPSLMRKRCAELTEDQLDTPYRPEGWTLRQVVHHCADSHMNAYIRFKLALTEDTPTIKAYDEAAWAELPDAKLPVDLSLDILDSLHKRWVVVIENMTDDDFAKTYYHPEKNAESSLGENLLHYAWHCRHHLAHISS
ncbi:YfiT family bacillithiol transferase [Portibacter lacus]|uniref:Metal-dependent hydrolase n=1 Tax=Portibacter lacus TaxID=1099794 RepID=A0AA37WEI9_9BACT|nr:putative metal-dependent hydrolase [Portibacter lacus]GLR17442.1 putative metal-dependent hydrolase [Portibacter lacus]